MRISVLLNRKSGTLSGRGSDGLAATIRKAFKAAGAEFRIELIHPRELRKRLQSLRDSQSPPDAIVVGGGDGSISTGARELLDTGIALGVLPLGTFNLFARALGMPLEPSEAVNALVTAKPAKIDTMQVNGRTVLQHASIGLQPRVILLREQQTHTSRLDKIYKGALAWLRVLRRPPLMDLETVSDRGTVTRRTPAVLISNNTLREGLGELPVSADLQHHRIAVYVCTSSRRRDLVRLTLAASVGLWRETGLIEEIIASEVRITGRQHRLLMSIDGELEHFDTPLICRSRPDSLIVLMPQPPAAGR